MVGLCLIYFGLVLTSPSEKRPSIILKTLLVLEAIAKVVLVAKAILTEKGPQL